MKTILLRLLMILALAFYTTGMLSACNTMEGAGDDIEDAGDAIEDAADDAAD